MKSKSTIRLYIIGALVLVGCTDYKQAGEINGPRSSQNVANEMQIDLKMFAWNDLLVLLEAAREYSSSVPETDTREPSAWLIHERVPFNKTHSGLSDSEFAAKISTFVGEGKWYLCSNPIVENRSFDSIDDETAVFLIKETSSEVNLLGVNKLGVPIYLNKNSEFTPEDVNSYIDAKEKAKANWIPPE